MTTPSRHLYDQKRAIESIMRMFDALPPEWRSWANSATLEPDAIIRAYHKGWSIARTQKHLHWQEIHRAS